MAWRKAGRKEGGRGRRRGEYERLTLQLSRSLINSINWHNNQRLVKKRDNQLTHRTAYQGTNPPLYQYGRSGRIFPRSQHILGWRRCAKKGMSLGYEKLGKASPSHNLV